MQRSFSTCANCWVMDDPDLGVLQTSITLAVAGVVGWPRRRPDAFLAHRGLDHGKRLLWQGGIRSVIAERGVDAALACRSGQEVSTAPCLAAGADPDWYFAAALAYEPEAEPTVTKDLR